jgi:hypothetical protein
MEHLKPHAPSIDHLGCNETSTFFLTSDVNHTIQTTEYVKITV